MSAVKKSLVMGELRKAQITEMLSEGKRLDNRGLLDYRPITVEAGVIEKANGSCRVSIGNTQLIAGIKIEIHPRQGPPHRPGHRHQDCAVDQLDKVTGGQDRPGSSNQLNGA